MQRWPSAFRFPGGESFVELQSRLTDTVGEDLQDRIPGEVVVAVSHADCIKTRARQRPRACRSTSSSGSSWPHARSAPSFTARGDPQSWRWARRAAPAGLAATRGLSQVTEDFEVPNPDRVTVGTVGPVGERIFLLQVREGQTLMTLKLEKAQVSALARFLGRMLGELERPGELPSGSELALEPFDEPDFVVRSLGVTYDEDLDRIILVADEVDRSEADNRAETLFGLAEDLEPKKTSNSAPACVFR